MIDWPPAPPQHLNQQKILSVTVRCSTITNITLALSVSIFHIWAFWDSQLTTTGAPPCFFTSSVNKYFQELYDIYHKNLQHIPTYSFDTPEINIYSIWNCTKYTYWTLKLAYVYSTLVHILLQNTLYRTAIILLNVKEPPAFANNPGERNIVYPYYVFYTISFPNVYSVANFIRSS